MQTINEIIIIISIALTVPFLFMCVEIFRLWLPSLKKEKTPSRTLAKGIVVGFVANFFDNVYWGIAWTLFLFDHKTATQMIFWGSLANVLFRQGGGIFSAFHHVQAANMIHKEKLTENHRWYWTMGGITILVLSLFKYK